MKQETLKKIVELADGYTLTKTGRAFYAPDGESFRLNYLSKPMGTVNYGLLLYRAVEGWNGLHPQQDILIGRTCIDIIDWEGIDNFQIADYVKTDYLTPTEQAIEACLIELLEDK